METNEVLQRTAIEAANRLGFDVNRFLALLDTAYDLHTMLAICRVFTPRDSRILTSFQNQLLEWMTNDNPKYRTPFSQKQVDVLLDMSERQRKGISGPNRERRSESFQERKPRKESPPWLPPPQGKDDIV